MCPRKWQFYTCASSCYGFIFSFCTVELLLKNFIIRIIPSSLLVLFSCLFFLTANIRATSVSTERIQSILFINCINILVSFSVAPVFGMQQNHLGRHPRLQRCLLWVFELPAICFWWSFSLVPAQKVVRQFERGLFYLMWQHKIIFSISWSCLPFFFLRCPFTKMQHLIQVSRMVQSIPLGILFKWLYTSLQLKSGCTCGTFLWHRHQSCVRELLALRCSPDARAHKCIIHMPKPRPHAGMLGFNAMQKD